MAYPYVARRLLAGDTAEMREKLLEVIFDRDGRLRIERLENLLAVVEKATRPAPISCPWPRWPAVAAGHGGSSLRQRLLLSLVRHDRLHTEDLRALLLGLMRRTFSARKLAGGFWPGSIPWRPDTP